jgi:hypothetical protein
LRVGPTVIAMVDQLGSFADEVTRVARGRFNNAVARGGAVDAGERVVLRVAIADERLRHQILGRGAAFELRPPSPTDEPGDRWRRVARMPGRRVRRFACRVFAGRLASSFRTRLAAIPSGRGRAGRGARGRSERP